MADDPTTEAMGAVALNLSLGVFTLLIEGGVISAADAHTLLDRLLTAYETTTVDDEANRAARRIVEGIAAGLPPRGGGR